MLVFLFLDNICKQHFSLVFSLYWPFLTLNIAEDQIKHIFKGLFSRLYQLELKNNKIS